jgi:predicted small integral membrane protein
MKKSTKAVLLSALVFPGLGHLSLKKYVPAAVLAGASFASIYYTITKSVENALQIVEKIQMDYSQPDVAAIIDSVSQQPVGSDAYLIDIATTVFVICWLFGIIDSYRAGRAQEKTDEALLNKSK